MSSFAVPPAAVPVDIRRRVPSQIVSYCAEPPEGDRWLYEVKHDGRRLIAIVDAAGLRPISRNGYDRTELFAAPFHALAAAGLPALVLAPPAARVSRFDPIVGSGLQLFAAVRQFGAEGIVSKTRR